MKIIVGRFQAHTLTSGHKYLIEEVIKNGEDLCVFIGETKNSERNFHDPLPFEYRKWLIYDFVGSLQENYGDCGNVHVFMIRDIGNVELWNKELDRKIESLIDLCVISEGEDIVLIGSRNSFIDTYTGKYKTEKLEPYNSPTALESATQYREEILKIEEKDLTQEMAIGIIWSYGQEERKRTGADTKA